MKKKKSWREKLDHPSGGQIVPIPPAMAKRLGPGTILIPRGLDVDAAIRRVKAGRLITQSRIRERLALEAGCDQTCPITTGIFVRIAAEAAVEDELSGKRRITPFWRVVRDDGSLNEKLPGGAAGQADRLKAEGHHLTRGKKIRVIDFETCLTRQ